MRAVIDIENNMFLDQSLNYKEFPYRLKDDAKIWCIVIYIIDTEEKRIAVGDQITKEWLKESLKDVTELIGHNIIKYDLLVLKLFGLLEYHIGYLNEPDTVFGKETKLTDTLILSRLFYPDRYGGHSLESWGQRVGVNKIDFRAICIEKGYIKKSDPSGEEFKNYSEEMLTYCIGDVLTNAKAFLQLEKEKGDWKWDQAIKVENKLADKAIRRETLGFWFDKDLALQCLDDLNEKMQTIRDNVEPILPPKLMNKGELKEYTLPARQINAKGEYTSFLIKFAEKHNAILNDNKLIYEGREFDLPYEGAIKSHLPATIDNLDHVKMYLIKLGWEPTEWKERDLTKDSKKQNIPYDKRLKALYKWYHETINGKYSKQRFNILESYGEKLLRKLEEELEDDKPVRVPTSPNVRVGVEKELCPNLVALGDKVAFAKDFALYLTYKHRKNSIAGGDTEDMDLNSDYPNTGYLSMYREEDGRVSTPSIEIGASTCRYRHIGVANIARATSIYGKEMRSLFGCGKDALQLGFDFSSLEARIQGHYCYNYTDGKALSVTLLAEKPNDLHTVTANKLGISRSEAKTVNYAILYGAQIAKIMKMLACDKERATRIYDGFWNNVPALKELKDKVEKYWTSTGKQFIVGIDGRKIFIRSKHSILNALFQSAGVIATKYSTIFIYQELEKKGMVTDPFIGKPDVCSMIEYHDEAQLYINKKLVQFEVFKNEEEAKNFKENWKDKEQLSTINEGNNNYYISYPNIVSTIINSSIDKAADLLRLNVKLGYEWSVNTNWYGCH